jgi:hypothetical protein
MRMTGLPMERRISSATGLAVAGAVLACAVSNSSFWIDETYAASKAVQPGIAEWMAKMRAQAGSDLQMPLYMFFLWGWEKLGGPAEWWLRLGNAPWFLIGFAFFCRHWRLALITAASPFLWTYLNEARPYAMQIGATLLFAAGCRDLFDSPAEHPGSRRATVTVAIALVLLSGSSLLGMFWAGAAMMALAFGFTLRRSLRNVRTYPLIWVVAIVLLTVLAGYYLWTSLEKARPASSTTDWRNVCYVFYEIFGLHGLGPGRLDIRTHGLNAFGQFVAPLLGYAVFAGAVAFAGLGVAARSAIRPAIVSFGGMAALGACVLFFVGYQTDFRVLARHAAPLVVFWLLVCGAGFDLLWRKGWPGRVIVVGFVLCNLLSCLELRFALRHAKDDYRQAAAVAKSAAARGKTVWWNADGNGAAYYGVEPGGIVFMVNPSLELLNGSASPDVVIVSKPDLYDSSGAVASFLAQRPYQPVSTFAAFQVWQRKTP